VREPREGIARAAAAIDGGAARRLLGALPQPQEPATGFPATRGREGGR